MSSETIVRTPGDPATPTVTTTQPSKKQQIRRSVSQEALATAQDIVLWKKPLSTVYNFLYGLYDNALFLSSEMVRNKLVISFGIITLVCFYLLDNLQGPHQVIFESIKKNGYWVSYWAFLGFLSSFGLGTGLHTFLLYLGPHIAHVTLAAWTCQSLDFPAPPYPDSITCPIHGGVSEVNFWRIFNKVQVEAISWGAGTAIGELPPYFMARAARKSGTSIEEDISTENSSLKKRVQELVTGFGFFGILLCASVPNPLFDLAGMTCGYFLIPFSTFFLATLLGKAVIKMSLQTSTVIICFTESYLTFVIDLIAKIPKIGVYLEPHITEYFQQQRKKLKHGDDSGDGGIVSNLLTLLVTGIIVYFVISIINSIAQKHFMDNLKKKDTQEKKNQ